MIEVIPATYTTLIANWPLVEPLLDSAMAVMGYRFLPVDILAELSAPNSFWQAWLVVENQTTILACLVTQIIQFRRRRGLCMFALGGERMAEWQDMLLPIMTRFAESAQCDHLELVGRPGWQRALGMKSAAVLVIKDLRNNEGGAME